MKQRYKRKPFGERRIALQRINILFDKAKDIFKEDKALANRYVSLARKISTKYKVRIPKEFKRRFCKHCYSFLVPGINCRVRLQGQKVVYYCLECKNFMRFPYIREKKAKRKGKK